MIVNQNRVSPTLHVTSLPRPVQSESLFLLPGLDFDRGPSGEASALRARLGDGAARRPHPLLSQRPRRSCSGRVEHHSNGRRQAGPTGREAARSARRHSATRAWSNLGRMRTLHAHADQARRRWQGCARGKHGLVSPRSAFRTCAAGCESPCLRRYVGPARACAPPMRTPQLGGPGSSILGPAGGLRAAGLSFIGLPGLVSISIVLIWVSLPAAPNYYVFVWRCKTLFLGAVAGCARSWLYTHTPVF